MKGEKILDKMSARCVALKFTSGDKKHIEAAGANTRTFSCRRALAHPLIAVSSI